MLLFLFFLVFLLYDVQLVIPGYGIVLYRSGSCGDYLQILLYDIGAGRCLCIRFTGYSLRYLQDLQGSFKN